ncbi:MAG: hypothetical protein K0U98_23520 [Deltaproteobacteria bacterium]|nr:hypothetical protein [Deltaproteobacteria bacterium]
MATVDQKYVLSSIPQAYRRPRRREEGARWGLALSLAACLFLHQSVRGENRPLQNQGTVSNAQAGEKESPPKAPLFLIESITVLNAERTPREILVSESRLKIGEAYSEAQLRDAVYRIVRLPFLLDAEFSLRKGSIRGSYELVVSVTETRQWFFGADYDGFWAENPGNSPEYDNGLGLLAGRRFFLGRRGVLSASTSSEDGVIQVGYTHYDLFNRNALLTVRAATSLCEGFNQSGTDVCLAGIVDTFTETRQSTSDFLSFDAGLAVPLWGNHSLQITASNTDSEIRFRAPDGFTVSQRDVWSLGLSWAFNSLDDPVFPTQGKVLITTVGRSELREKSRINGLPTSLGSFTVNSGDSSSLSSSAQKYWSSSRRTSFSVRVNGSVGHQESESTNVFGDDISSNTDFYSAGLTLGHALSLFRAAPSKPFNELRWENTLNTSWRDRSGSNSLLSGSNAGFSLTTGLRYRTTWGVFSLNLSYVDPEI